jgi:hypothetical protein
MSTSLNDFQQSIRQEIVDALSTTPHHGNVSGDRVDKIICIHCDQPEAWTYTADPYTVHCNRQNFCGISSHVKNYTPEFFGEIWRKHPPTEQSPLATATAYLQGRSIDTDKISGQYGQGRVAGFHTVSITPEWSKLAWHRLIGKSGKNKVKWDVGAKYGGKAYTTSNDFSGANEIWIVEGAINLWSLEQVGFRGAATLASGNVPDQFYESLDRGKKIILAFDADNAGEKAIPKNLEKLKELGFENVIIALPPSGKDWNDLLLEGRLNQDQIELTKSEALHRGRLFSAPNAETYGYELWVNQGSPQTFSRVFEFQRSIYLFTVKDTNSSAVQIADAGMRVKFVQISENGDHSVTLEVKAESKTYLVNLKVEDLLSASLSEVIARKTRRFVSRNQAHLPSLFKYLNQGNQPEIRDTGCYGFDKGSRQRSGTGYYTFHGFAVDPEGKLILPEKEGQFFEVGKNQYIRGESQFRAAIKKLSSEQYPVQNFTTEIYQAFGGRGLLSLGFWFASLFQQPIRDKFGFFPFLSLFGDPAAGKSTLGIILNRALSFSDWEGIPMSRTNTLKGPQRIIASQSSVAVPLLEWTPKSRINEEDLLNLYGGNPQQVKAERTPDSYVEVPFRCSLVIITNTEPFDSRQVKERVISLKFNKDELTLESKKAALMLKNIKPERMVTVGVQLLQDRKYFESEIIGAVEEAIQTLEDNGIDDRRIADNHGFPLGGLSLLLGRLAEGVPDSVIDHYFREAQDFCLKSASDKIISAQTEFAFADDVLQKIDEEADGDRSGTHKFARYHEGRVAVKMVDALDAFNYPKHLHREVKGELKRHERYISHDRGLRVFGDKKQKVWEFKQKMD